MVQRLALTGRWWQMLVLGTIRVSAPTGYFIFKHCNLRGCSALEDCELSIRDWGDVSLEYCPDLGWTDGSSWR